MYRLYSLLIYALEILGKTYALFNPKASLFFSGRRAQFNEQDYLPHSWNGKKIIWIHSASYGEYEMSKPIYERLKQDDNLRFVFSFFSPSGYEQVEVDPNKCIKLYLPVDHMSSQKELIDKINPACVIFIKYDFWFNLLRCLARKKVPYYFTSLHLNKNHYLFHTMMRPFLNLLKKAEAIYCHNSESIEILSKKGFTNLHLFGDSRLTQVQKNKQNNSTRIEWKSEAKTLVLGSLLQDEFDLITQIRNAHQDWNIIIAPHEIDAPTIASLAKLCPGKVDYFSQDKMPFGKTLIVDTMGDLKYLYHRTNHAYVGGGFDKGPHNVLEPLVFGVPTYCGPNIKKFPMAQYLSHLSILTIIRKKSDLVSALSLNIDQTKIKETISNLSEEHLHKLDQFILDLNKRISN